MKLFSKVMVNRLKPAIPILIDPDQTGFVQGRGIAENFVYAADLLSCCHKRAKPTAILKLDFKKAFDSVFWDSLNWILLARGVRRPLVWLGHKYPLYWENLHSSEWCSGSLDQLPA